MRVPVPVEELCRAALDDARFALGKHAVELEIDPHLPPVEVDETMIRQVLVNLLENAAIHDPGPIKLRALRAGRRLELRVIDHGPGVPEAERQRIFEAFHRLRSPDGVRERGTGLGLAIARGFVEAHDGTIRVETTIGGGATFIVSLPLGSRRWRLFQSRSGVTLDRCGLCVEESPQSLQTVHMPAIPCVPRHSARRRGYEVIRPR